MGNSIKISDFGYVYVLDKKLFPKIKELSKPYPKKDVIEKTITLAQNINQ